MSLASIAHEKAYKANLISTIVDVWKRFCPKNCL